MTINWRRHRREEHGLGGPRDFLRQIVYGGNDGIVTTFAVVSGFAGAEAAGTAEIGAIAVLVFGLANLFADGVSMGLGEVLAARSQAVLHDRQRRGQLRELKDHPEKERAELVQILEERGLDPAAARRVSRELVASPDLVADLMMTYELEMPESPERSPYLGGLSTFVSFILFGFLPLIPYMLRDPLAPGTFGLAVAATAAALALLGILRAVVTRERLLRGMAETLSVGGICAVVAYGVGALVAG
ncbi:VIT1/CCC1 transporter family protein [Histidinibacterium lentulum]|uniref:GMP synthase n=1 Tax=Histidinibacterium lentulum TaxID=2480588 RepID=A0A3N2R9L8_9RHOB|nr:VIT1/CCC1 transporter family protein [Histidinibacterium lentulum]ROU04180.1 GMP synthase [Histidinibacterium lentulum]